MTAPAIGGSAVVLAAALVWRFQPEPRAGLEEQPERAPESAAALPPAARPVAEPKVEPSAPSAAELSANMPAGPARAPLPGETPQTPMATLVAERQNLIVRGNGAGAPNDNATPDIVAGELEFAAEPIDATWAPAAEAEVLAKFAQMPGLKLIDLQVQCRSTMCRIEFTQPDTDGSSLSFNILRDSLGLEPRWMMMVGSGSAALRSVGYFWRAGFAPQLENAEPERAN